MEGGGVKGGREGVKLEMEKCSRMFVKMTVMVFMLTYTTLFIRKGCSR